MGETLGTHCFLGFQEDNSCYGSYAHDGYRLQECKQGRGSPNGKRCMDPVASGEELRGKLSHRQIVSFSLKKMTRRLNLLESGGARRGHIKAAWLAHNSAMETEILTLSAQQQAGPTKKHKIVDVAGRLFTRGQLHGIS
uniref:AlNc14C126G6811 protein n=1 Tax=Albugo laibachii Nc14 TaxID=890382 RepID=F0WJU1_9STRA|nr:AlNc14C126G6811 [Albugo laibachii Nc14]|eukprot:CCA21543.1 AlNc14C126G6811 [Albugo laibachii Nc14]